jgi:ferredoxin
MNFAISGGVMVLMVCPKGVGCALCRRIVTGGHCRL